MNKTNEVLNIVCNESGVSCSDVCTRMNDKRNVTSGILSTLKRQGRVYNEDGLWYARITLNVYTTIDKLNDVHLDGNINTEWSEGYVSALVDSNVINEHEFDMLINISRDSAALYDFDKVEELVEIGRHAAKKSLESFK